MFGVKHLHQEISRLLIAWRQPCHRALLHSLFLVLGLVRLPTRRARCASRPSSPHGGEVNLALLPTLSFRPGGVPGASARPLRDTRQACPARGSKPRAIGASAPRRTGAPSPRAPAAARGRPTSSRAPAGAASGRLGPRSPRTRARPSAAR